MKQIKNYQNKKVLVLGLARSGMSAATLLHELGAFVTVNDGKKLVDNPEAQELLASGVTVITGSHPTDLLDEGFSLIVKNPGIPYTNPILEKAIERQIPIITDVELAYEVSEAPIIGITGTNGKTTTTTMIWSMLIRNNQGLVPKLAGNIGFPASEVASRALKTDVLVTELSSFQLMGTDSFCPRIAVITNLFEAHLDYHGTRDAYVAAKWNIQKNMTKDHVLILNGDQPELLTLAEKTKAKVLLFSTQETQVNGAYVSEGIIYYEDQPIMPMSDLGVPGTHNVENALAAILVVKQFNVSNESIKEALSEFSGVPHRTEYIGQFNGCKVYNDSKATNVLATEKALSGFQKEKLILIAGGLDRGNEFDELLLSIQGMKGLIAMGETKNKLAKIAQEANVSHIETVENMAEAVTKALALSEPGDMLLLSPACASWDMYPNFESRGFDFVNEVKKQSR